MNKTRTIAIVNKEAKQMQAFLDGQGQGSLNTIVTYTADFGKGIQADIKVCDADKESTPFIDAVLFHEGSDIGCLDVGDELLGKYIFKDKDNTYTVVVVTDKAIYRKAHWFLLFGFLCLVCSLFLIVLAALGVTNESISRIIYDFFAAAWAIGSTIVCFGVTASYYKQIPRKYKIPG